MSTIKDVALTKLKLDPENPRLPASLPRDERSIVNHIAKSTAIEDLMDAIARNGFFPGEPVVVVPGVQKDTWTVVEGNRRLTAVKLLENPYACDEPSRRMISIAKDAENKPSAIPVVECLTRSEVLPYLGFRHITGVKEWEPLAKARYIEQLFILTGSVDGVDSIDPSIRYSQVARAIGSRKDHIKRNLDALAVYKVMEHRDFFGISGLDEESIKFSILSTALADDRIGSFVGVSRTNGEGTFEPTNPIVSPGDLSEKEIKELVEWLYKPDGKGRTRVGESRNLRQLAAVLNSRHALEVFRDGATLEIAYQKTSDVARDFMGLLYQAEGILSEAAGMVANVCFDENAFDSIKRVRRNVNLIGKTLEDKKKEESDEF